MKIFTIISALLLSVASYAAHMGEIAILSNSGEKFYVVMDGNYQNYQPQTTVNMQAPANGLYNFKIYAANNNFIFDRNFVVKPNTRMTYKIVKYNGHYSLNFFSESPLYTGGNQGQGSTSCHPPQHPQNGNHPNNGYGNNGYGNGNNNYGNGYGQGSNCGNANMLNSVDFDNLKKAIAHEAFSDDKLRVAKSAAKNKRFSVSQVKEIARMFPFSSERLAFSKAAYANCFDKQNYYEVMEVLTFSSEKEELEAFLDAQ